MNVIVPANGHTMPFLSVDFVASAVMLVVLFEWLSTHINTHIRELRDLYIFK
jgi:hypothetical protein